VTDCVQNDPTDSWAMGCGEEPLMLTSVVPLVTQRNSMRQFQDPGHWNNE